MTGVASAQRCCSHAQGVLHALIAAQLVVMSFGRHVEDDFAASGYMASPAMIARQMVDKNEDTGLGHGKHHANQRHRRVRVHSDPETTDIDLEGHLQDGGHSRRHRGHGYNSLQEIDTKISAGPAAMSTGSVGALVGNDWRNNADHNGHVQVHRDGEKTDVDIEEDLSGVGVGGVVGGGVGVGRWGGGRFWNGRPRFGKGRGGRGWNVRRRRAYSILQSANEPMGAVSLAEDEKVAEQRKKEEQEKAVASPRAGAGAPPWTDEPHIGPGPCDVTSHHADIHCDRNHDAKHAHCSEDNGNKDKKLMKLFKDSGADVQEEDDEDGKEDKDEKKEDDDKGKEDKDEKKEDKDDKGKDSKKKKKGKDSKETKKGKDSKKNDNDN